MAIFFTTIKSFQYIDFFFFKKKKIINIIRDHWGKDVKKERKFKLISIYYKLIKRNDDENFVDENTWEDLNMNSVFSLIDRNISAIGSQYLYSLLHKYEKTTKELSNRFNQYKYFLENQNIREKILVYLYKLRENNAYFIPNLIFQKIPKRPKLYIIFYFLAIMSPVSMLLIFVNPVYLLFSIPIVITNFIVSYFYGRKVFGHFVDISYLSKMLRVGIKLSELETEEISQLKELKKLKEFSISLNKKIGWLIIDKSKLDDISTIVIDYFNYFCLFNIVSFVHSIHYISANQDKLKKIFELIGSLDATIAIASYLKSKPYYCCAKFNVNNHIYVDSIYHPLLEKPVSNCFDVQNKSVLITGSNMAGKTTFIKTIGLNIILGRTISICLAKEANLPESIVKSSIKRADDINENISYYFKEIESVLEFIKVSSDQNKYLFLIDEIFRGTNTIERIAAATSVLKYLAKYNLLFVTTHDIELQKLLDDKFNMYHFSEQIEAGKHYFNYQIQSGPTSSRNAIKLLELKGYPKNVVKEANNLAEQFSLHDNFLQRLK